MTPTVTVWPRLKGLPIATTQSPCCICAESPNFASCSAPGRHFSQLDQRAVGQRVAADDFCRVSLSLRPAPNERHLDVLGPFDDVVVGEDEAGFVDDEAGAGPLRELIRGACAAARFAAGRLPRPAPKKRRSRSSPAAPPPKNSVSSCVRARASVRMFTTVGVCALAMLRNVVASIGPLSGALFIAGTFTVCAEMPASDRAARRSPYRPRAKRSRRGRHKRAWSYAWTLRRSPLCPWLARPVSELDARPADAGLTDVYGCKPASRSPVWSGPVTRASRSPMNMLISVRTPKRSV